MNREEAGRDCAAAVWAVGSLERPSSWRSVFLGEGLQEKGSGGGTLPGCSGLQSMGALQVFLAQASEHGCLLPGCSGPGLQSQPISWMEKEGSRPQDSGNAV